MITLRFLFSCYTGYAGKMLTPAQTHTSSLFPLLLFMGAFPLACPSTHLLLGPSQHLYGLKYLQDQIELSDRKAALQEVETALDVCYYNFDLITDTWPS